MLQEERREEEEIERLKNHVISLKDTIGKMSAEVECLQVAAKKVGNVISGGLAVLSMFCLPFVDGGGHW